MEKVKLTKAQAVRMIAALNKKSHPVLICNIIRSSVVEELGKIFEGVTTDKLILAIYEGYDVIEETPEERVKELYDQCVCRYNDPFGAQVVREVLAILNIKIEGVNA